MRPHTHTLRDPTLLAWYMHFRDHTVTPLFAEVEQRVHRHNRWHLNELRICRSTIGHLRTGHRMTVPAKVAWFIEDALAVHHGTLFAPRVSRVLRNTRTEEGVGDAVLAAALVAVSIFGMAMVTVGFRLFLFGGAA